jgi:hypothetical protein
MPGYVDLLPVRLGQLIKFTLKHEISHHAGNSSHGNEGGTYYHSGNRFGLIKWIPVMRIPILQPIHPPIPPPRPLIKPGFIDRLRLAPIGKLAQAQENNDDLPHGGCYG